MPVEGGGELYLPQPAYGIALQGDFSLTLIADHGRRALNPKIIGNYIEYVVEGDGSFERWRCDLTAEGKPEAIENGAQEEDDTPAAEGSEVSWVSESSLSGAVAISPDNSMVAANFKGGKGGLWISDNNPAAAPSVLTEKAGGSLILWAPNSSKIAYTDEQGNLWAAYPAEGLALRVFIGKVYSVAWAEDSSMLVFSAKRAEDEYSKIFMVVAP
jgi:hypothetical protein